MEISSPQTKKYLRELRAAVRDLQKAFPKVPEFAVIFGSGLGLETLKLRKSQKTVLFTKISHFPRTTVLGHGDTLHYYSKSPKRSSAALILQGRQHYYEGASSQQTVFPLRALALWGVKRILLTNASGSLSNKFKPGRLVWIKDHINFTGQNPLRGPNLELLGPRFPSLNHVYQNPFSKKIRQLARRLKITLPGAVYVGTLGPSYETPAELTAFKKMGGDLVGMSTVLEAIAAAHAGVEVAGLSAVTNICFKPKASPTHEEVLQQAHRADKDLARIIAKLMDEELGR